MSETMKNLDEKNRKRSERNRERVRELLIMCPGILPHEISERTRMSPATVDRHIEAIRAEWLARDPVKAGQ